MKRSMIAASAAIPLALFALCVQDSGSSAQTTTGPVGTLNTQKTELTVQFPNAPSAKITLNAPEVERMIQMLAQMRADMNPPRPMVDPAPGSTMNIATVGRWYLQPDGTGIDVAVLHPGYGWVGIFMDRSSIEQLNRSLARSIHPVAVRAKHSYKRE
jgi:hypothetical protein